MSSFQNARVNAANSATNRSSIIWIVMLNGTVTVMYGVIAAEGDVGLPFDFGCTSAIDII